METHLCSDETRLGTIPPREQIKQGNNANYFNLTKDIYTGCSTTVKLHKESDPIAIKKGVRQGDTISPKLFTACLENIYSEISTG